MFTRYFASARFFSVKGVAHVLAQLVARQTLGLVHAGPRTSTHPRPAG